MFSSDEMSTDRDHTVEAAADLLAQANSLACRVATLEESPRKRRLRAALDEIRARTTEAATSAPEKLIGPDTNGADQNGI